MMFNTGLNCTKKKKGQCLHSDCLPHYPRVDDIVNHWFVTLHLFITMLMVCHMKMSHRRAFDILIRLCSSREQKAAPLKRCQIANPALDRSFSDVARRDIWDFNEDYGRPFIHQIVFKLAQEKQDACQSITLMHLLLQLAAACLGCLSLRLSSPERHPPSASSASTSIHMPAT